MMHRRLILGAMASLWLSAGGAPIDARAQGYPSKPVIVMPAFPPGAPNDLIVRMMAEQFQAAMKQPMIVDNRPGAGGNIAAELVARAVPDGHTLLATVDTVVTVNPLIYRKLNFKADHELVPVVYLANTSQTLVCHPSVPVKSVGALIAHAKAHPMSFASGGQGVPGHLAAELFMSSTGVTMVHIPYKGPGPATQDVLAGVVPCGFLATAVVMPHVKAGKLLGLAVTSARRSPIAPELPTMAEAGVVGYEAAFGEMLLAPKGTSPAVVARLNEVATTILQRPEIRERMLQLDLEFVRNTPEEAGMRVQRETEKWKLVVDRLGLQAD